MYVHVFVIYIYIYICICSKVYKPYPYTYVRHTHIKCELTLEFLSLFLPKVQPPANNGMLAVTSLAVSLGASVLLFAAVTTGIVVHYNCKAKRAKLRAGEQ